MISKKEEKGEEEIDITMRSGWLFCLCSLLMASLFALSASFQFNDPDWYLWLPLYVCGCIVNLMNGLLLSPQFRLVGKFTFWLGLFLLIKVVIEDYHKGIAGFWSLDMRERVIREKLGSGLVIASMFFHLGTPIPRADNTNLPRHVIYGMVILVIVGYGLSFEFFLRQQKEMKF